jgi:hypothetical protein
MSKKKQQQSLFQSNEARILWDASDDAILEEITLGDLYPHLYMPPEVASIVAEILMLHKFKDKDRAIAMKWIEANIENID